MTTYKPGDKVVLRSQYFASSAENNLVPGGTIGTYSRFVRNWADCVFPCHIVSVPGVEEGLPFFDNEVEPFNEDQFDTEGVTAAKNIAYSTIDGLKMDLDDNMLDDIELADRIIEDLKAAGVVFPDSIKDPHALGGQE